MAKKVKSREHRWVITLLKATPEISWRRLAKAKQLRAVKESKIREVFKTFREQCALLALHSLNKAFVRSPRKPRRNHDPRITSLSVFSNSLGQKENRAQHDPQRWAPLTTPSARFGQAIGLVMHRNLK
jgi:hypothetical protein